MYIVLNGSKNLLHFTRKNTIHFTIKSLYKVQRATTAYSHTFHSIDKALLPAQGCHGTQGKVHAERARASPFVQKRRIKKNAGVSRVSGVDNPQIVVCISDERPKEAQARVRESTLRKRQPGKKIELKGNRLSKVSLSGRTSCELEVTSKQ